MVALENDESSTERSIRKKVESSETGRSRQQPGSGLINSEETT